MACCRSPRPGIWLACGTEISGVLPSRDGVAAPCTESAGLSRMPSRRTMAGKAVALAGVLGEGKLGLGDGREC